MTKPIVFLFVTLLITACAHHRDVRPGAEGVHRVVVPAEDEHSGSQNAISQANHFCKEQNKMAVFIDENQKYTGSMDESTYKTAKTVSKVAEAAGGATWVFGRGRGTKDAGAVVGMGGGIADSALGNGYTVEMKFKCQ